MKEKTIDVLFTVAFALLIASGAVVILEISAAYFGLLLQWQPMLDRALKPMIALATGSGIAIGWIAKHKFKLLEQEALSRQGLTNTITTQITATALQAELEDLKGRIGERGSASSIEMQFVKQENLERIKAEITSSIAGEVARKQADAANASKEDSDNRAKRKASLIKLREAVRAVKSAYGSLDPSTADEKLVMSALKTNSDLETANDGILEVFHVVSPDYDRMMEMYRFAMATIIAAAPPLITSKQSKAVAKDVRVSGYRLDAAQELELKVQRRHLNTITEYVVLLVAYLLDPEHFKKNRRDALATKAIAAARRYGITL